MTFKLLTLSVASFAIFAACAQANDAAQTVAEAPQVVPKKLKATSVETSSAKVQDLIIQGVGAKISDAPAGIYKADPAHSYLTFQYLHQGYARPTLRWNEFDAEINVDPSKPTNSSLSVVIDTTTIDSGVEALDEHLLSEQFFDADNHPEITFESATLTQNITGQGKITGNLIMKGVSKPVTLDVKLNKVGEHFQSKKPIIGISATTRIKRSDWGLGQYVPLVGDEVDISIEAEFVKVDE